MKSKEKIVLCVYNKAFLGMYALLLEKVNDILEWDYELHSCRSGRACIEYLVSNILFDPMI